MSFFDAAPSSDDTTATPAAAPRPGKGIMMPLDKDTYGLLDRVHTELGEALEASRSLDDLFKTLGQAGWSQTSDDYGRKAYIGTRIPGSDTEEFRFTVVYTKRGDLQLDMRRWY